MGNMMSGFTCVLPSEIWTEAQIPTFGSSRLWNCSIDSDEEISNRESARKGMHKNEVRRVLENEDVRGRFKSDRIRQL